MKNKKIFKEVYQEKINKDKNYDEIIARLNNQKTIKKKYFNLAYICTLILILVSLLIINKSSLFKQYLSKSKEDIIKINTIDSVLDKEDLENHGPDSIDDYDDKEKLSFDNLNLPKDFTDTYITKLIYNENNQFNNFEAIFYSIDNRKITISYAKENKPKNIYNISNAKTSRINRLELVIYYIEEDYICEFKYKNINYLVKTEKLKEDELITLLKSIII